LNKIYQAAILQKNNELLNGLLTQFIIL